MQYITHINLCVSVDIHGCLLRNSICNTHARYTYTEIIYMAHSYHNVVFTEFSVEKWKFVTLPTPGIVRFDTGVHCRWFLPEWGEANACHHLLCCTIVPIFAPRELPTTLANTCSHSRILARFPCQSCGNRRFWIIFDLFWPLSYKTWNNLGRKKNFLCILTLIQSRWQGNARSTNAPGSNPGQGKKLLTSKNEISTIEK